MSVTLLTAETITCNDRTHMHHAPIQDMVAMDINGHYVQVTKDGEYFSARIDRNEMALDVSADKLFQFIRSKT
jgi:hypothetical protein